MIDKIPQMRILAAEAEAKRIVFGDEDERIAMVRRAAILSLVKYGHDAHSSAKVVNGFLPQEERFHSNQMMWKTTGGIESLVEPMSKGGVIPKGFLGKWTPDFIFGLVRSGAIRSVQRGGCFQTTLTHNRPALREAFLGELPFNCRTYALKDSVRMTGMWAGRLGADDPEGVGVLVGMLAGAGLVEAQPYGEEQTVKWAAVPSNEFNASLLKSFGIPHVRIAGKGHGRGSFLVAPFWGALLSGEMPEAFGRWYEDMPRRWGGYPEIPRAFLHLAWGSWSGRVPEGTVPHLMVSNFSVKGLKQKDMRMAAFVRYGMSRVDPRIREAWLTRLRARGIRAADFPAGKVPAGLE